MLDDKAEKDGKEKERPRDRIVRSARELFRRHGIRAVGVEAIAEAAGSNKMTLYRNFGSKDDLLVTCLNAAAAEAEAAFDAIEAAHPGDPIGQLRAWVQSAVECVQIDGRGCDLANCAVELGEDDHPARHVIEQVKVRHHARLVDLCRRAGVREAELLADALFLLVEGARVNRQSEGAEGASAHAIAIAEATMAAFVGAGKPAAGG